MYVSVVLYVFVTQHINYVLTGTLMTWLIYNTCCRTAQYKELDLVKEDNTLSRSLLEF
jgi:hypothetical protein